MLNVRKRNVAPAYLSLATVVAELDRRLDQPAPRDPTCSPVQVGDTRTFMDYYETEPRKAYVVTLLGNYEVTVIIPIRADGDAARDAISNVADVVTAELFPPPVDD